MTGKAKARLIYSTISTSERISGLGVKGALLFTWLLAHCDDQGRYAGSARKVKAEVAPILDEITLEDTKTALGAMAEVGLIIRYSEGGRDYLQTVDWWEFNAGLRYSSKSRHPAPEGWVDRITERGEHGKFVGGGKGRS